MKRLFLFLFLIFSLITAEAQQQTVSIGDTQTKPNAVLYLKGDGNQGLIIPIVTALGSFGEAGMIAYNNGKVYYHTGSSWVELGGGAGGGSGSTYSLSISGNNLVLKKDGIDQDVIKISDTAPAANSLLVWDGTKWTSAIMSGDAANTAGAVTVNGLKGKTIPALPATTQALVYNGTAWVFQPLSGTGTVTSITPGTGLTTTPAGPITTTGTINVNVGTGANQIPQLDGTGKLNSAVLPSGLDANAADDVTSSTTAGGDLAGLYPNPTVGRIQGRAVVNTAPTDQQVLKWNQGQNRWEPGADAGTSYTAGTGVSITGTTITNTGDTDATNDLTTTSIAGGDLSGTFSNLQIGASAITNTEISPTANITPNKLDKTAGAEGQVLKIIGGNLTYANDNGSAYTAGSGISIVGTTIANTGDTDASDDLTTASPAGGDVTGTLSNIQVNAGAITDTEISATANISPSKIDKTSGVDGQVLKIVGGNLMYANDNGTSYSAGTGISITGSTIDNTGDTDASNDITTTTVAAGDIAGTFSNLQIGANAVTGPEIANSSVSVNKLVTGGVTDANKVYTTNASGSPQLETKASLLSGTLSTGTAAGGDLTGSYPNPSIASTAGNNVVTAINGGTTTSTINTNRLNTGVVLDTESPAAGDISGSYSTGFQIGLNAITDNEVNAAANISGSKIVPTFNQNVTTTGDVSAVDGAFSGNVAIQGIPYTWPSINGTGVLTNDGAGGLSWSAAAGGITQVQAGTGLSGGGSSGIVTLNLANTAVTAGSYGDNVNIPKIIVDGQGRITSAVNVPFSPGMTNPMTTTGDLIVGGAGGTPQTLPVGSDGQVLMVTSGSPAWQNLSGGGTITGITTAAGSGLTGGGVSGTLNLKLVDGSSNGQVLKWNGSQWALATDDVGGGSVPTLAPGQILIGDGTNNSSAGVSGDLTMSGSANFQIASDAVTAIEIAPTTITNAEISPTAQIAVNKLAPGAAGQVLQTVAGAPTWTTFTGGATDLNGLSDAIISTPASGHLLIYNTISSNFENKALSGDVTVDAAGVTSLGTGVVGSTEITDLSVATADLANSSVTNAKIQGVNASKINGITTGYVPRADATGLITGIIQDNGTEVGIKAAPVANTTLYVGGSTTAAAYLDGDVTVAGALKTESININKPFYADGDPGLAGQVLTSAGPSGFPTWTSVSGGFSTLNTLPKGNGTGMVASQIFDNGTSVGIGTTTPGANLQIDGSTSTLRLRSTVSSTLSQSAVSFGRDDGTGGYVEVGSIGDPGSLDGLEIFSPNVVYFNVNFNRRFTFGSNGQLGVGASSDYGTAGQVLTSGGGSAAPTWTTPASSFTTLNAVPRGNGSAMVASSIFDNGTFTGVGNTAALSASSRFDVQTTNGSGAFGGMYVKTTEANGKPFYGYGSGGAIRGYTYIDGSDGNKWKLLVGASDQLTITSSGNTGIGTTTPVSRLDVEGGVSIGANYSGTTAAPTNGAIVEGNVGIGTITATYPLNVYNSTNTRAVNIENDYAGASTQYGMTIDLTSATGTGGKYGIDCNVSGTSASTGTIYGLETDIIPNGTGIAYGVNSSISTAGTGSRYGVYSSVGHGSTNTSDVYGLYTVISGSGTGKKYGLYATGEDENYFSGDVKIGTTAVATAKLDLRSSTARVLNAVSSFSGSLGQVFNFERTLVPSAGNDIFQIKVPIGSPTNFQFFECEVGSNVVFRVDGNGSAYSDGTFNTGGADYAEMVEVSDASPLMEAGDVVVIDVENGKMKRAAEPRSTLVAGIYSTKPGIIGSEKTWDSSPVANDEGLSFKSINDRIEEGEIPLAMLGIVPCKVSTENGPIKPGDLLVTSSTPGHAMKDENPKAGTIVGKALQELSSGTGVIKVMVTLQ